MPIINIVSRWDSAKVLFSFETTEERRQASGLATTRDALEAAAKAGANLRGAYLRGANLTSFRDDVWAVLSSAPAEAAAVLTALQQGKVDGSTYTGGCACLVGTIAKARSCSVNDMPTLQPNSFRLAEVWFAQIKPGNTPENHEPTRLTAEWVSQWINSMRDAFGQTKELA